MAKLKDEDRLVTWGQLQRALSDRPTVVQVVGVVNEGLRRHDAKHHRRWWTRLRVWSTRRFGWPWPLLPRGHDANPTTREVS